MIRIHSHAALLVSQEPEALAELLATESTRGCIGPKLSPVTAWVDHRRVDVLREALIKAGYAPKVASDGGSERPNDGT
ncbi:MAG: hypothetical protein FJX74_06255 [Armatimonadetes bacterium]|nr:hypothetical protein [Armatimonadota bacterium]